MADVYLVSHAMAVRWAKQVWSEVSGDARVKQAHANALNGLGMNTSVTSPNFEK